MKRISIKATIGMAAILLLTAACTDELNDRQGDTEYAIAFTPATETRAAVESGELPENSSFNVWGWYGTENNITNQVFANNHETVTKSGNSWGYTGGTQYWIKGMTYNFYGVYPANLGECSKDGIITVNEFDCSKFGEEAVDLMTAMAQGSGDNPQPVVMPFKHALTRITFSAKLADGLDEGYSLQVNEVALWASNKGDMTQNMNQTDSQPVWITQPYLLEGDNEGDINEEYNAYLYRLTSSNGALIANPISKGDAVPLNVKGKGDLLVVPQEMNYTRPVLAINYTLSYGESTSTAIWKVYPLKGNTDWTPGTSLNYTFTIDEDNAYFNVNVGNWIDGNLGKEEIVFE